MRPRFARCIQALLLAGTPACTARAPPALLLHLTLQRRAQDGFVRQQDHDLSVSAALAMPLDPAEPVPQQWAAAPARRSTLADDRLPASECDQRTDLLCAWATAAEQRASDSLEPLELSQ